MTIISAAFNDLQIKMREETAAARAAIKLALQHARHAGLAYEKMRGLISQSELNQWLASPACPVDRHTIMTCRRISMTDLTANARTLADLMFDAAATHIAQGSRVLSRAEKIEQNRKLREQMKINQQQARQA